MTKPNKNSSVANKAFVVLRNGIRVSDQEYRTAREANHEYTFWNRVVTNWSPSCKLEIVEYIK